MQHARICQKQVGMSQAGDTGLGMDKGLNEIPKQERLRVCPIAKTKYSTFGQANDPGNRGNTTNCLSIYRGPVGSRKRWLAGERAYT